jgi:hypothetical protein
MQRCNGAASSNVTTFERAAHMMHHGGPKASRVVSHSTRPPCGSGSVCPLHMFPRQVAFYLPHSCLVKIRENILHIAWMYRTPI